MTDSPFNWQCEPRAEEIILKTLEECVQSNATIAKLQSDLFKHTSTRLFDWLDHVIVSSSTEVIHKLEEVGFVYDSSTESSRIFYHPGAQLPRVIVSDFVAHGIAVCVESIADFLSVRGISGWIEGSPYSAYRRCLINTENNHALWVVERRGSWTMEPTYTNEEAVSTYIQLTEKWLTRPRGLEDEDEAMKRTLELAQELVLAVGRDLAACIVCACERHYWQARNTAGQIQKNRQDKMGMGWANHDHHTFRSSRRHFHQLVRLFEILGFHCRERFYAGQEAGWGAQVVENSTAKLVAFLDVDLAPEELHDDFAHETMPELPQLGTIGLWCALHGDSILKSGMHHLESQFMFDELTHDLAHFGIGMMDPFSSFPHLRQAFTAGEIWPVEPIRVQHLLDLGRITKTQAEKFLSYGAVGSHMENLQRREGFKGFNQKNVSVIIRKTDPRLQQNIVEQNA